MSIHTLSRGLLAAAVLGACALPCAVSAQDSYDYAGIDVPGTDGSQTFGINNSGISAGTAFIFGGPGGSVPFTYDTKKGTVTLVDPVAGFDDTSVLAISNRGSLVGNVFTAGVSSGLLLDKRGNATVFDHPDSVGNTSARAINSRGLIVGIYDRFEPLFGQPFPAGYLYDPRSDEFTALVPDGFFTIAQGINARGEIVGSSFFFSENDPCNPGAPPGGFVSYAWLRDTDGDVQFFTVNGSPTSRARGITDSGTVAGFFLNTDTGTIEGFVTDIGPGQCQDIVIGPDERLVFPGGTATFAQSISNKGVVVGQYNDADGDPQSFVATPN
ncbi:DUF3466 family protein [Halomonas denitrificans]|nr:DUF3466 family protein [Halomonas denitrificans]